MSVTIITALFDIQREKHGDGRKMEDYFQWLQNTLNLNANFIIFTEPKLTEEIKKLSNKKNIHIVSQNIDDIEYYHYKDDIQRIIDMTEYKKNIKHPDRIECKWPLYNIIQYSKFGWLKHAIETNYFKTDYFFWMDAGCSRFFYDVNIDKQWPSNEGLNILKQNKFVIQGRSDLYTYNIDHNFYWDSSNLLYGTLFGGCSEILLKIGKEIKLIFETMIKNNQMNNEQLALAILWKTKPELFSVYLNNSKKHLPIFEYLSM